MKLSDAFIHEDSSGDFEWTATVINLNHPDISQNLLACKALADYVIFIKNEPYQDMTLEQVEKILKGKA